MLNVSDTVKNAYRDSSVAKYITLTFPDMGKTIPMEQIYQESMSLQESVIEGTNIEFVGCIASCFKINVYDVSDELKNQKIVATIYTTGTEDAPINLFSGYVYSALKQSNKRVKEIVAYDAMYSKGNKDVAQWYAELDFPLTIKEFRDSLFGQIGITQVETTLVNDEVTVTKEYSPASLNALSLIKAICQMNGVCGIINRDGNFEYRTIEIGDTVSEAFDYYKSVSYEDYTIKAIDKVKTRETEDDEGITYGDGENTYIIQNNIFITSKDDSTKAEIVEAIYGKVNGMEFTPFTSNNNGLPYIECGDTVSYSVLADDGLSYVTKSFLILSRTLSGIQNLRDAYEAEGEEYQTEFITDLQIQLESYKTVVKNEVKNLDLVVYTYTNDGAFDIGESEETIINIRWATSATCTMIFMATIPFEIDKDGNAVFEYYINNSKLDNSELVQYCQRGQNFVTLTNYYGASANSLGSFQVKAHTEYFESDKRQQDAKISGLIDFTSSGTYTEASIDETIPGMTIADGAIKAVVFAQGTVGDDEWDGYIDVSDIFSAITINDQPVTVNTDKFSDSVSVTFPDANDSTASDVFTGIMIDNVITVGTFTDTVVGQETVTNYTFTYEDAAKYTYDTEIVIVENDTFELTDTFVLSGAEEEVDEGLMSVMTIDKSNYASVGGIEVE